MTLILGIETSSAESGVALCRDGSPLAELEFGHELSLLTQLPSRIEELLSSCGAATSDISGVGVSTGPGSFTGLRIGLSTAKAIAYALTTPIVGLGTLEVLARNVAPEGRLVCPMISWRKEMVFCAAYKPSADGELEAVLEPWARLAPEFLEELVAFDWETPVIFVGDAAEAGREEIAEAIPSAAFAGRALSRAKASVVAQRAHQVLGQRPDGDDIATLAPKYLQKTYVGTD